MSHPVFGDPVADTEPVITPVTCAACGCRLERSTELGGWFHYGARGDRDARGCKVACAREPHGADGRAYAAARA